jgi:xylulokinase
MTRAVLEGVAFGLKDSFRLIQENAPGGVREVRVSGGGAKSLVWRQIMADVLGATLVTTNSTEGAAFGAALLAAVAAGVYADVPAACRATIRVSDPVAPGANQDAYAQPYANYQELYPALKEMFTRV